ncbi:MAG: RNA 2'-phosphotransferase [Planctomycetales bacterium]|nr:RNA 2'-phosphotransferase [Planctomycetales bacterium]
MTIDGKSVRQISKFLSLMLRHQPARIGIELDDAGWAGIDVLLEALRRKGQKTSRDLVEHVVRTTDKQRVTINETSQRIRGHQGHAVDVDLVYELADPSAILLHGTPLNAVAAIREGGLRKMSGHHVHRHCDSSTAPPSGLEEERRAC